jgi:hypothetical protein
MSEGGHPDPDLDQTEQDKEESDISMDDGEQEELLRDSGEEAEGQREQTPGEPDPALKERGIANKSPKNKKKRKNLEELKEMSIKKF